MDESLQQFHRVIGAWFEEVLGLPTPPQVLGWPSIIQGKSTLILAPTGSGKTLAAFLAAIDAVARRLLAEGEAAANGVEILYISPLKALANDVRKNLLRPLEEMEGVARRMGEAWPEIRVGIRHGDTPVRERAAMVRHPPHILVTTPESLNLMLTTAARRVLTGVRYVIVDEAHALAGNKRGVFLTLLLERLEEARKHGMIGAATGRVKIAPGVYQEVEEMRPLVRIGLSATATPEETVARWLGGFDEDGRERAVTIVRAGQRKRLDLEVICPQRDDEGAMLNDAQAGEPAGKSLWPQVTAQTMRLIREHRSTLVFANSRRLVERLTSYLQEQPDPPRMLPHHGSISKNVRLETEEALKKGELSAVVATASLELGIDVGALDLVVQIDSPGTVTAALQRVGRAGHLEKATAKGRLLARGVTQLAAMAVLVPLMLEGTVEPTVVPENCLDVLAQMIVAACAVGAWDRGALYRVFKRATPYAHLQEGQFDAVVAMLARRGRHVAATGLRPKISWDKVNDQLIALPAAGKLVLTNGGVISDSGQFPVYLAHGAKRPATTGQTPVPRLGEGEQNAQDKPHGVRLGELDEEFVFETKEGDRVLLGSQLWRVISIDADRVLVGHAEPGPSRMPFWRGESAARSDLVGGAMARFYGEVEEAIKTCPAGAHRPAGHGTPSEWLMEKYHLEFHAAEPFLEFVARQRAMAAVPTDRRIVAEHFHDKTGEPVITVLCPLGARVNHALRLALEARFAEKRLAIQINHTDDGLVMRPPAEVGVIPDNPLALLSAGTLEQLVLEQLEDSSLFGIRFRQNAARALMLPRVSPTQRTPLWQQRLRARHLLALVKQERNFPIVLETYRECLQDTLNVERARKLLADIEIGAVEVVVTRAAIPSVPSPMSRYLFSNFEGEYLYAGDDPLGTGAAAEPAVDIAALDAILQRRAVTETGHAPSWNAEDVAALQRRIEGSDYPARTAEELVEKIAAAGPVALGGPEDAGWRAWVVEGAKEMLQELFATHRLVVMDWMDERGAIVGRRVVATETLAPFLPVLPRMPDLFTFSGGAMVALDRTQIPAAFFHTEMGREEISEMIVLQAVRRRAVAELDEIESGYPFIAVRPLVVAMVRAGVLVAVDEGHVAPPEHLEQLRHMALRRERKGAQTADVAALQRHLLEWHRIGVSGQEVVDAVEDTLERLSAVSLPLETWQCDVLPARVAGFMPVMLERVCAGGHWVVVGSGNRTVAFWPRHLIAMRGAATGETPVLLGDVAAVLGMLEKHGASYEVDLEVLMPQIRSIKPALAELFFAGLVSNDSLATLRAALDAPADEVATGNGAGRYPAKMGVRTFRGHVSRRGRAQGESLGGRWFVLPRIAPADETSALQLAEQATELVERLLRRHGFACRELADGAADGTWRSCYEVLTRMEWAGTIRRGYFVEGITGSQFAVPGVQLDVPGAAGGVVWLAMLDPANLYGHLETKWVSDVGQPARVPRMAGSWLALIGGRPVLAAVSYGQRLIPLSADVEEQRMAVAALGELAARITESHRTLTVRHWGAAVAEEADVSILETPMAEVLRGVGFVRDTQSMRLYRSYASAGE